MRAIYGRQKLLLGEARWSQLDSESQIQLRGGAPRTDSSWWGLLGRMARSNGKAVWDHEAKIRRILDKVVSADDTEFPDVAVAALQELTSIDYVAHGTATLLLTLARPDRLTAEPERRVPEGVWQAIWDEPFDPRKASKLSQAASMALRPALVCRLTADGWSLGENLAVPRCSRGCVRLRTDVAACSALEDVPARNLSRSAINWRPSRVKSSSKSTASLSSVRRWGLGWRWSRVACVGRRRGIRHFGDLVLQVRGCPNPRRSYRGWASGRNVARRCQRRDESAARRSPVKVAWPIVHEPTPGPGTTSGSHTASRPASVALCGPVHLMGCRMGTRGSRYFITCCNYVSCVSYVAVERLPVELPGLGRSAEQACARGGRCGAGARGS